MKRIQKGWLPWIVVTALVMMSALSGCATLQTHEDRIISTSYKTLIVGANAYEVGMPSLIELWGKGLISNETYEEIKDMALMYWSAYHTAAAILEAFAVTMSAEDEERLYIALAETAKCLADLIEYMNPILQEHGKPAIAY